MARGGKKAKHSARGKVKKAEERRKKRQRSEELGVCLPSRPLSPFLTCVMLDATPEAVEGAGLEPADVPPGEPRTCRQHAHVRRTRLSLFGRLSFTLALTLLILSEMFHTSALCLDSV